MERYLSQLDAGAWHSRAYAGEPLPTLAAVSSWCIANGLLLNIEIKPTPGLETATGEAVAREAQQLWAHAPVPPLLTSFRPESLAGARSVAPQLPRGLLLDTLWAGWLTIAEQLGCVAIKDRNSNRMSPSMAPKTGLTKHACPQSPV